MLQKLQKISTNSSTNRAHLKTNDEENEDDDGDDEDKDAYGVDEERMTLQKKYIHLSFLCII